MDHLQGAGISDRMLGVSPCGLAGHEAKNRPEPFPWCQKRIFNGISQSLWSPFGELIQPKFKL
jgi:hypothetical protein